MIAVRALRREKTTAKSNFTNPTSPVRMEVGIFRVFAMESSSNSSPAAEDANEDYRSGLQVETSEKTKEEDAVLQDALEVNIERTASEAKKCHELKDVVQVNLWSKYGQYDITTVMHEAEKRCDEMENLTVEST